MNTLQDHALRRAYQLSLNEYGVLTEIYFLSHNTRYNGWCIKSKDNIAQTLDLSRDAVFRAIQKLEEKGLIEKNENRQLRTTDKFNSIVSARDGYALSIVTEDENVQTFTPSENKTTPPNSLKIRQSTVLKSDSTPSEIKTPTVLKSDANITRINNKINNSSKEESAELEILEGESIDSENVNQGNDEIKREYGNQEINLLLAALKKQIGIDAFADSKVERFMAKHLLDLGARIGREEFSKRLRWILDDAFKRKNCNRIRYLYAEMKSFIPIKQNKGGVVFIS